MAVRAWSMLTNGQLQTSTAEARALVGKSLTRMLVARLPPGPILIANGFSGVSERTSTEVTVLAIDVCLQIQDLKEGREILNGNSKSPYC